MKAQLIRYTCNDQEIISVISDSLRVKNHFTIWKRNDEGEVIFQTKATLLEISESGDTVFDIESAGPFNLGGEIYIAGDGGQVIYKTELKKAKNKIISTVIPLEMKYKERRKSQRKRFKKHEHKEFELIYRRKAENGGEATEKIVSRLVDVTDDGACFLISKASLAQIDVKEILEIKSLAPDVEIESDRAMIVSSRKHKGMTMGHEEMFAVGIVFI